MQILFGYLQKLHSRPIDLYDLEECVDEVLDIFDEYFIF